MKENASPGIFCPRFFSELSIRDDGSIAPCCAFSGRISHAGRSVNIGEASLDKMFHEADDLLQFRSAMLSGKSVLGCASNCAVPESLGAQSHRTHAVRASLEMPQHRSLDTLREFHADHAPSLRSVHLQGGNLCNFKCRMCRPLSSSSIASDKTQSGILKILAPDQRDAVRTRQDWHSSWDAFKARILPALSGVRVLSLTGGEPLMNPVLRKLIIDGLPQREASQCKLIVTTNGSVADAELIEGMTRFQRCQTNISIDGVGALSEYIRHGAKWIETEAAIDSFASRGFEINLAVAIQAYNVFDLPGIAAYSCQLGRTLDFSWVFRPYMLNASVLPSAARQLCLSKLSASAGKIGSYSSGSTLGTEAARSGEQMLSYAMSRLRDAGCEDKDGGFVGFCRYTKALDESRGERLEQCAPELYAALSTIPTFMKHYLGH